uniref:PCI domain-containing protein n=1 Tax=Gongylonema pulchrum TaxID=637853 RepID=A0A183DUX4_9BILA
LEQGDREEYNQCQSQLKLLYREIPNSPNRYEFTSYRLLYYISVANTIDQTTLLSELDEKAREDPCIEFALKTREAWALGNYVKLFRLYEHAPRMASYVMDLFLERERKAALNACLKSYVLSILNNIYD